MEKKPASEKQQKAAGQRQSNFGGMYILGIIFAIVAIGLIRVQLSVRYSMREESLSLLSKEELIRLKTEQSHIVDTHYIFGVNDISIQADDSRLPEGAVPFGRTLLIYEENDPASRNASDVYIPVLDQMKEDFNICEVFDFDPEMLLSYEKVILAITHYGKLQETVADIRSWVHEGGNLMIAYPPEMSGSFQSLYEVMGIKNSGANVVITGFRSKNDFLIGGADRDYNIIESFESSLGLALASDCEVFMESSGDYPVPLIWKRNVDAGSVVVDNFGIMGKDYRGIHCAAYTLLGDCCIYPVINGTAFYLDDFPSPVPEGDSSFIDRDYHLTIADFYSQVWWNDIYNLGRRHGIRYTGVVIEDYNDTVSGDFDRNTEVSRFQYFGNMLLRRGGEIGIHGYNHMPLVLRSFDYSNLYDSYITWPTVDDISRSLDEVFAFSHELFPKEELQVYVPPSNILSVEGRRALAETSITSISGSYIGGELSYEQEFTVSKEDGIVDVPRITSGCLVNDYFLTTAMSELNFHYVNTHFLHPDDALDVDRGAELGWETLYSNLSDYIEWLYDSSPSIRNLTGSEIAAAVQNYDLVEVSRSHSDKVIYLSLDYFLGESWMFVRLNHGEEIDKVIGGDFSPVANNLYLVKCEKDTVEIRLK